MEFEPWFQASCTTDSHESTKQSFLHVSTLFNNQPSKKKVPIWPKSQRLPQARGLSLELTLEHVYIMETQIEHTNEDLKFLYTVLYK